LSGLYGWSVTGFYLVCKGGVLVATIEQVLVIKIHVPPSPREGPKIVYTKETGLQIKRWGAFSL